MPKSNEKLKTISYQADLINIQSNDLLDSLVNTLGSEGSEDHMEDLSEEDDSFFNFQIGY